MPIRLNTREAGFDQRFRAFLATKRETSQDIEAMAGLKLGPGTLYGAIARLEECGWIEPLPAEERRRPYKLTNAGQKVLRARLQALLARFYSNSDD